jgi:hypothetical protein
MPAALILLYALGFSANAYRDWFKSLCALLLLTAVLEHPAMPKAMLGIQGLNPWNILLVNVILGWLWQRRREDTVWDFPRPLAALLALYLGVVVVSFARMITDRSGIDELTGLTLVSEYLINPIKWLIPGLLLFDGCRTRQRLAWGLGCSLAIYVILALLVIHSMQFAARLSGIELTRISREIISSEVGYHAVDMGMILAGAAWAILAAAPVLRRNTHRVVAIAATAIVIYAQALTAGRMGYLTWIATGVTLCTLRRHNLFLVAPVLLVATLLVVPGAWERMVQGLDETEQGQADYNKISSDRLLAWVHVIDKIGEAPLLGYGRLAMKRTGIAHRLQEEYRVSFPHPHNAYLEWVLDNGVIGLLLLAPFYVGLVVQAARLFRSRDDPWGAAVGAATLALVVALLVASLGSQTFYPREGTIGMWAFIGLCLRCPSNNQTAISPP